MKIETFKHHNVLPDGTFDDEDGADEYGTVETKGKIVMSQNNGGCDLDNCICSEGHWISIIQPVTEFGIVEGVKVLFDNNEEMKQFFNERELVLV